MPLSQIPPENVRYHYNYIYVFHKTLPGAALDPSKLQLALGTFSLHTSPSFLLAITSFAPLVSPISVVLVFSAPPNSIVLFPFLLLSSAPAPLLKPLQVAAPVSNLLAFCLPRLDLSNSVSHCCHQVLCHVGSNLF